MCLFISEKVYKQIVEASSKSFVESGGLLGTSDGRTIDNYMFDEGLRSSVIEYVPNLDLFESTLDKWRRNDIRFLGIIHSHAADSVLSGKDIRMAKEIIHCNKSISSLLMPLVTINDHQIYWYRVGIDYVKHIDVRIIKNK